MQLAHTDGGDNRQVVGAEQVVLAQSDKVAEPVRLGGPLVQPVHVLEGVPTRVQLADPDERPTGAVQVVVPDPDGDGKAKWLGGSFVQPGRLLEGA